MSVDVRSLPPVGYKPGTNQPIFSAIPPEQREKWKKRWSAMDDQGAEKKHYRHFEWELRKTFSELETREIQLDECIRSKSG